MSLLEAIRRVKRAVYPQCLLQCFPTRYLLCALVFFGLFNVYSLRVTLNVAIIQMNQDNKWNKWEVDSILGSFYYCYIVTNLLAGRLAELYGANLIFGLGIAITSLLNLLTPLAASGGYGMLMLVRILEGVAEGLAVPAMYTIFGQWCPKSERTVMRAICESGFDVGTIAATPLTAYLCTAAGLGGWPSVFYFFGIVGLVWWLIWLILAYETPAEHAWITEKELQYILSNQGIEMARKRPPLPWFSILTNLPFWSLAIGTILSGVFVIFVRNFFPIFMSELMGLDLITIGWLGSLPTLIELFTTLLAGCAGDLIIARYPLRRTWIRKAFNIASTVIPLIFLGALVAVEHNPKTVCVLIAFVYGTGALDIAGSAGTIVDMTPAFAGSIYGVLNALGNLNGITTPYIVTAMTKGREKSWAAWYTLLYFSMGLSVAATLIFVIFGSSDLQSWGVEGDNVSFSEVCCCKRLTRRNNLTCMVSMIPVAEHETVELSGFPSTSETEFSKRSTGKLGLPGVSNKRSILEIPD